MSKYSPSDIILTIVEYTQGMWTVEDVCALYEYIWNEEIETQPTSKTLKLITGIKNGEQTNEE
jgi:hypothetical protein